MLFRSILRAFHREEQGQDLAEYCLLAALVALVALGIVVHVSGGMRGLWAGANTVLENGQTVAASPTAGH